LAFVDARWNYASIPISSAKMISLTYPKVPMVHLDSYYIAAEGPFGIDVSTLV
jgi:hypothetical protein